MKRNFLWMIVMTVCLLGCFVLQGEATSLFQANNQMNYLFSDHKARAVGDTLTIIISETTSTTQRASTSTSKSTDQNYELPFIGGSGTNNVFNNVLDKIFPMSNASESQSSGTGSTTRSGNFQGQLSVMVKEVLPNGDFFVEGKQKIKVNKEDQEITVTGIVRPVDISPYNTVLSSCVGNAEISYKGKGVISDKQRPGILTRLFDWIF